MALQLEQKQAIVAELNAAAGNALSAVVVDHRGVSVAEMTDLRRRARESGVYLRVVRNTLLKRAVVGTDYECLAEVATGPTMLAFSNEDPGSAARLFKDAVRDIEKLDVKALSISGQLFAADEIDRVATLPTRDEAIVMLMGVMRAPVVKLVQTLMEVPGKLTRTLAAVGDSKEAQAG
ncbi:MAG: 50S ribosomal protein L10 [Gammaproteobacteria bacterium]|nr:50S ribosomal protein L10 [Gammaproteobacteria bacterium]MXY58745.1 50S ribosomal protein L10 [Gammaproteobacteria bacterium]MYF30745.1 50S ribosomal protein L10 [Gammaproteobacteria bacterium]MYK46581.1 50S ribosomal protein L10 [Gammaproteobacteria bacterium]